MDFSIFIFAAIYIAFAVALFLNDEADFALIWLLFMPLAFIYMGAGMAAADSQSEGIFYRIYDLLSQYFIPLMAWIFMFFIIHLWRSGHLPEAYARIKDLRPSSGFTGYRAQKFSHAEPCSAALMGTSTGNFSHRNLSVRDQTFIDLSVYALQIFNQGTNIAVVNYMGLPSEYYRSVHTRISGQLNSGTQSIPEIVRPFLRDVGGNYDMPHKLLADLCEVAIRSENTDRWTRTRLHKIAKHLKQPKGVVDQAFYRY